MKVTSFLSWHWTLQNKDYVFLPFFPLSHSRCSKTICTINDFVPTLKKRGGCYKISHSLELQIPYHISIKTLFKVYWRLLTLQNRIIPSLIHEKFSNDNKGIIRNTNPQQQRECWRRQKWPEIQWKSRDWLGKGATAGNTEAWNMCSGNLGQGDGHGLRVWVCMPRAMGSYWKFHVVRNDIIRSIFYSYK